MKTYSLMDDGYIIITTGLQAPGNSCHAQPTWRALGLFVPFSTRSSNISPVYNFEGGGG